MKIKKILILAAFLTIFGINSGRSQGLGSLLNGDLGNTLGNLIEGVFSSSNITIADMAGEWDATGPAVCFQGEGFLKKAGGAAAAAAIETKLSPYYEQYGLNNAKLVIDNQGAFTLTCKMIKLNGMITQASNAQPGVFEFNFTALGMRLATVTTYVQKTSRTMDIMFDATKLKKLLSAVASFTGINIVQTISGILDSYDGLAVGFHFNGTSSVNPDSNSNSKGYGLGNILGGFGIGGNNNNNSNTQPDNDKKSDTGTLINGSNSGKGTNNSGKGTNNTSKGTTDSGNSQDNTGNGQNANQNNSVMTGLDLLRGILGGGKKK